MRRQENDMVLIAFVGELGCGKTLALTYLAWRNSNKGQAIYANYHLNFDFTMIDSPEKIEDMREGFFAGDELWSWCDSRVSGSNKNKVISAILLKSRKRGINIGYTAQHLSQVDKRMRNITDFIALPQLTPNETECRLRIHHAVSGQMIRMYRFKTAPIFQMYSTNEEIKDLSWA
jgi:hypothetical protein